MEKIKIPIGMESFEEIRTDNCYYVDKTKFILELLDEKFSVNLITRPRRFGKTLMMNMLQNFFDIRKDSKRLFEGLTISKHQEICDKWMNQWPVLFISFKDIATMKFEKSYNQLAFNISDLCIQHSYLQNSDKLDENNKEIFARMKKGEASETELSNCLFLLTRMLHAHYEKKVILLIDEYDVPLAKADEYGYYKDMLNLIRSIMSIALKTNEHLKFAVITGCLRIAKESIFTGANHFVNNSIDRGKFMDAFGFTEAEVEALLKTIHQETKLSEMKQWYDGYQFGNYEMYCPWDVVNHASALLDNPNAFPGNYWKDTSHNNIIRRFIGNKNFFVNEKFETLLSGGNIPVKIRDDLTYDFDNSTEDNLWSILYLTGYLTKAKEDGSSPITMLKIPNEEVKTIFADTVVDWFRDTMMETNRSPLMESLWNGDEIEATRIISRLLRQTISYHNYKEDYYHAFLVGVFVGVGYAVESDKEHGEGRPDIIVKDLLNERIILIEVKHSTKISEMENDCLKAANQLNTRGYADDFLEDYETILCYGVSFYRKKCMVKRIEFI